MSPLYATLPLFRPHLSAKAPLFPSLSLLLSLPLCLCGALSPPCSLSLSLLISLPPPTCTLLLHSQTTSPLCLSSLFATDATRRYCDPLWTPEIRLRRGTNCSLFGMIESCWSLARLYSLSFSVSHATLPLHTHTRTDTLLFPCSRHTHARRSTSIPTSSYSAMVRTKKETKDSHAAVTTLY